MRFFKKTVQKDRFPDLSDELKDASPIVKIQTVLEQWKTRFRNFKYDVFDGKFSLSYRGVFVEISTKESPRHAVLRVAPRDGPFLYVDYPLDNELLKILKDVSGRMMYSGLDLYACADQPRQGDNTFAVTTRACLQDFYITPASFLHAITEIADGYWWLAKAFFNTGRLEKTLRPERRNEIEQFFRNADDIKLGLISGKLAKQVLPDDFSSLLKKDTVPLTFYNMLGDEPGGSIQKLKEYVDEKAPGLMREGHMDVYGVSSKYLTRFVVPVTTFCKKDNRSFDLETVHQGFSGNNQGFSRYVFLALRYKILVANTSQIDQNTIKMCKDTAFFSWQPRIPVRYNIEGDCVELQIILPLSILAEGNFAYPEYPLDVAVPDNLGFFSQVSRFEATVAEENERMQQLILYLKSAR
jgi:hypothetical protein